MYEIDSRPTDFRCLDELGFWSRIIVSRHEGIGRSRVSIRESDDLLSNICIFEVVSRRLEMIDLAILCGSNESIQTILDDDEIISESLRRS